MKHVMITTQYRGLWCCQVPKGTDLTGTTITGLEKCRMVIKWRGGKGFQDIGINGPCKDDLLSTASDIPVLHYVTGVFEINEESAKKIWEI